MTTKMAGTRKRGRLRKRWIDEVEEDLKIMGIRNGMQWQRTVRNGGKFYWKPKSTADCSIRGEEEEDILIIASILF
jgi:hypothetical protein